MTPHKIFFIVIFFLYTSAAHAQTVFMLNGASTVDEISNALSGKSPAKPASNEEDLDDDDFDMQSLIISSSGQDVLNNETDIYRTSNTKKSSNSALTPPGIASNASALGLHINFENNSSYISPSYKKVITSLAEALKKAPDSYTLITGHADSSGTEHYNQLLSFERAASLRNALAKHGVPSWRVVVMGYGSLMPLPGLAESDSRNRRIQIWKMTPNASENRQRTATGTLHRG